MSFCFQTLKRSPKQSKEQAGEDDEIGEGDHLALFGKWQTEPLCLPHAVGGIVPKVKMLSSGRGLIQSSYLVKHIF